MAPLPRMTRVDEIVEEVVGLGRLELPTSRLSSARSNQLSYKPDEASCSTQAIACGATEKGRETKAAARRQLSIGDVWDWLVRDPKTSILRKEGIQPQVPPRPP